MYRKYIDDMLACATREHLCFEGQSLQCASTSRPRIRVPLDVVGRVPVSSRLAVDCPSS